MNIKFSAWLSFALIAILQSCSINTETTYYRDSASSMESHILLDKSMMGMMSMMGNNSEDLFKNNNSLSNITTDWKSLYDIQKEGKIVVNPDSAQVLKKLFLKVNKEKNEIYGLSIKYDKLLPNEITNLLAQNKKLKEMPLQNFAQWNGKTLTIDTDKFNSATFLNEIGNEAKENSVSEPKTKSDSIEVYGNQMKQGFLGMIRMFNMNFSNTLKFQKPIKTIVGEHDFVKKIDNKTIQINVRSNDLFDGGKSLVHKDKKIVITTE